MTRLRGVASHPSSPGTGGEGHGCPPSPPRDRWIGSPLSRVGSRSRNRWQIPAPRGLPGTELLSSPGKMRHAALLGGFRGVNTCTVVDLQPPPRRHGARGWEGETGPAPPRGAGAGPQAGRQGHWPPSPGIRSLWPQAVGQDVRARALGGGPSMLRAAPPGPAAHGTSQSKGKAVALGVLPEGAFLTGP